MRTQLLGLTAAALTVGTLSFGLSAPAGAIGGLDGGQISGDGSLPSAVDVVGTTPGDGMAAWIRSVPGGVRIQASAGTDGGWAPAVNVTPTVIASASDLRLVGNDRGDVAAVWTQPGNGGTVVRGARYLGGGQWDGSVPLTSVAVTDVLATDAAMDASGRVQVATGVKVDASNEVHVAIWPKGQAPAYETLGLQADDPSIAVAPSGRAIVAWEGGALPEKVRVRTHDIGGEWSAVDEVPWPDDVDQIQAGIADDGRATVAFLGVDGAHDRVVTSDIGIDGQAGGPDIVSPAGITATDYGFDVAADGRATATWSNPVPGGYALRMSSRAPATDFSGFSTVESGLSGAVASLPFVRSNGKQVVVHASGGELTFRYRANPAFLLGTYEGGPSDGPFAADTDSEGNVVAVSLVDDGPATSFVQGDWLDTAGPVATVTGPPAGTSLATALPVKWSTVDSLTGTKSTDVIVRSAPWNGGFGPQQVIGNDLVSGSLGFTATPGSTHCFSVQAVDNAGNLGYRSDESCTTVPLDDTALTGKKWKRVAPAGAFNTTATVTKKKGRKLVLTGVQARHLALLVTKTKKGGKVKVLWNGALLKKVSLNGSGPATVTLADLATVQTGTLTIKVISKDGRKVSVDGLVVGK
jgi:hypothetical protein